MSPSHTRTVTVLVAGAVLLASCDGSGTASPTSSTSPRTTASGSPPPTLPPLPSDLASADPCGHAGSAFTAASTYVGLAQLGRTDEAQRCVRPGAVPRAVTAALASGGTFYVPGGATTGSTIRFVAGGSAVTVTSAASGDGYTVTSVRRG